MVRCMLSSTGLLSAVAIRLNLLLPSLQTVTVCKTCCRLPEHVQGQVLPLLTVASLLLQALQLELPV